MSDVFLERVRRALAPDFAVGRLIAAGGMGLVYLAHDTQLDRPVAVKVLKPELAKEALVERFRREPRLLAKLTHPNVVAVHKAGEADGLSYYVMEYVPGETLATRLERGPLSPRAVDTLAAGLLDALVYAHGHNVIHRDLKPSNIFGAEERPQLGDFGIAHLVDSQGELTETGQLIGTRAYMAPEQLAGDTATVRSDLYSLAAVLYEASTGRRWRILNEPATADWSGVPPHLVGVLQRALAHRPDARWTSAAEFRSALTAAAPLPPTLPSDATLARRPRPRLRHLAFGGAVVLTLAVIPTVWPKPPAPCSAGPADLAVVPFGDGTASNPVGRQLARHVAHTLEFPRWRLVPVHYAFAWWDTVPPGAQAARIGADLCVPRWIEGDLVTRGRDTLLQLSVRDTAEARLLHTFTVRGSAADVVGWGRGAADSVVRRLFPPYTRDFREQPPDSRNGPALEAYFDGQDAFRADDWTLAETGFRKALAEDPEFGKAKWYLALVLKWQRDLRYLDLLRELEARGDTALPELQRLLTRAELEPDLRRRISLLADAAARYDSSTDATLLYANELFHRGPLLGIPLDSGIALLGAAARAQPNLTAVMHTFIGSVRLGDKQSAAAALSQLPATTDGDGKLRARLLSYAFARRFSPWAWEAWGTELHLRWRADEDVMAGVDRYVRIALFFDLPESQLTLADILAQPERNRRARGSAYEARGLALIALGRPSTALQAFDSAAALLETPEVGFQAAQWALLLPTLGLPPAEHSRAERARIALDADTAQGRAARAAWTMAIDALARGDSAGVARRRRELVAAKTGPAAELAVLLDALALGWAGRYSEARSATDRLIAYGPHGLGGDPFARAVLHLNRGEWQRRTGAFAEAERTWRWTEAWDVLGWAMGAAQAGEIDAATSPVARLRRAGLAVQRRDSTACAMLARVRIIWKHAEPGLSVLRREADSLAGICS
jgi:hypothetical protein